MNECSFIVPKYLNSINIILCQDFFSVFPPSISPFWWLSFKYLILFSNFKNYIMFTYTFFDFYADHLTGGCLFYRLIFLLH